MFGHEKGSMGEDTARNKGKFELASGGTLFLDEIGDMNLKTQAKILRALESKTFQRIGGGRIIHMDVRIVVSTNKDLEQEIKKGNFREELFYRLNVIPIHVPALRERKEDIPDLVDAFLKAYSSQTTGQKKKVSKEVIETFVKYDWPGNVRELKNLIERLSIMVQDELIDLKDIPSPYSGRD